MFGFLNIDKPLRMTSRDVVNCVQPMVRPAKIGHGGTLDPLASGVLVIGIGQATRLFPYLSKLTKSYRAEFHFGFRSETLDCEAAVEKVLLPDIHREQLDGVLEHWRGEVVQVPPAYSAVKVRGKRSYELARRGQDVALEARQITIHKLEVIEFSLPALTLDIECSSGTYIRSLGHDIATELQTSAVMTGLKRTAVGPFRLQDAVTLEQLSAFGLMDYLCPPEMAIPSLSQIILTESQVKDVVAGRMISLQQLPADHASLAAFDADHSLVAILAPQSGSQWRAQRCFRA